MLTRRVFMRGGAMVMAGMGAAPAWLARAADVAVGNAAGGKRKILVAIFQRGAADGLNVVVPFADKRYYDSPDRKKVDPDPVRHLVKNEHWMLRDP